MNRKERGWVGANVKGGERVGRGQREGRGRRTGRRKVRERWGDRVREWREGERMEIERESGNGERGGGREIIIDTHSVAHK